MLEILSGPHNLLDLEGNPVADDSLQRARYYDDDVGLILSGGATLRKSWVIQLDGTACLRGESYGLMVVDLQRPGEYLLIDASFNDKLHLYDKRSATRISLLLSGSLNAMADIQVRASDRFLSALGTSVKWRPLDISAAAVTEATLAGAGSGAPVWSRTRHPDILALAYEDGKIVYYNHRTKAQAPGAAFIGPNKDAWYSPRHNIWVRLTDTRQIYIHAATPRPAALSAPAGAAPVRGNVTTFTSRVTGDAGEPVPGELVEWSLQAGSVGQLSAPQSRTDDDGYASIDYVAPLYTLGNATIQAALRF